MPSVHTYTSKAKWEEIKKGHRKVKGSMNSAQERQFRTSAKFYAFLLSMLILLLSF